jgi:hypothetical protein
MPACQLFGHILEQQGLHFLLDVAPQLGHAREFRLAGQIWFTKRECLLVTEPSHIPHGGPPPLTLVEIPEHVARAKARKRKRR